MSADLSAIDRAKQAAAARAVEFVEPGMRLGLGTGSTAAWMVRLLGRRVREEGLRVTGVPTSRRTAELALEAGVPLVALDEARWLDLTIDGADEIGPELGLIKGGGAALLHEKIVAAASDRMVVIADAAKRVGSLGAFPLPVEVIGFGWQATRSQIAEALEGLDVMGRDVALRMADGVPVRTDEGNLILDLHLFRIGDPRRLATVLNLIPGVVDNGLFLDMCDTAVVGHADGRVEVLDSDDRVIETRRAEAEEPANIFREG
jgi:ribose 5-phosphate isomerase A